MASTIKELLKSLTSFRKESGKSRNFAKEFLGKFKDAIPKGKSSVQFIKGLRASLYGKIR